MLSENAILDVLDQSAKGFTFPMLDNGYFYLAASRLSLFRSNEHWAIVFEIFGFSPREGHPSLGITTIASQLHGRNKPEDYVSNAAYENYLKNNPNWEMRSLWPISDDDWMDQDNPEQVGKWEKLKIREEVLDLPDNAAYTIAGIDLEGDDPAVFELCRYLAHICPEALLATESERRASIPPDMKQVMMFDEWHHPDLANGQLPSQTKTFQSLATVLKKNDPALFDTPEAANNHWRNWPEGGSL